MGTSVLDLFHLKRFEFTACMFWASDPAVIPPGILEQGVFHSLYWSRASLYWYLQKKTSEVKMKEVPSLYWEEAEGGLSFLCFHREGYVDSIIQELFIFRATVFSGLL